MRLTQATAVAIATAASQLRDDWDHPGILAALRVEAERGTPAAEVNVALANLIRNPHARTPGLLNKPGRHWTSADGHIERRGDHDQACPDHPEQTHPCPECRQRPDPDVTEAGIAAVRAAMAAAGIPRTPKETP